MYIPHYPITSPHTVTQWCVSTRAEALIHRFAKVLSQHKSHSGLMKTESYWRLAVLCGCSCVRVGHTDSSGRERKPLVFFFWALHQTCCCLTHRSPSDARVFTKCLQVLLWICLCAVKISDRPVHHASFSQDVAGSDIIRYPSRSARRFALTRLTALFPLKLLLFCQTWQTHWFLLDTHMHITACLDMFRGGLTRLSPQVKRALPQTVYWAL